MEKILKGRKYSYAGLFKIIGPGNYIHVPLENYSRACITIECSRQNKYAGCKPMNEKYATSSTLKKGYVTIYQRY